jgi:hypothetical protein
MQRSSRGRPSPGEESVRRDHRATVARRPARRHPNFALWRFLRRFADKLVA